MVMDVNQTCGNHFTMHTDIKSLCRTPEMNTLCVKYVTILQKEVTQRCSFLQSSSIFCVSVQVWGDGGVYVSSIYYVPETIPSSLSICILTNPHVHNCVYT